MYYEEKLIFTPDDDEVFKDYFKSSLIGGIRGMISIRSKQIPATTVVWSPVGYQAEQTYKERIAMSNPDRYRLSADNQLLYKHELGYSKPTGYTRRFNQYGCFEGDSLLTFLQDKFKYKK